MAHSCRIESFFGAVIRAGGCRSDGRVEGPLTGVSRIRMALGGTEDVSRRQDFWGFGVRSGRCSAYGHSTPYCVLVLLSASEDVFLFGSRSSRLYCRAASGHSRKNSTSRSASSSLDTNNQLGVDVSQVLRMGRAVRRSDSGSWRSDQRYFTRSGTRRNAPQLELVPG